MVIKMNIYHNPQCQCRGLKYQDIKLPVIQKRYASPGLLQRKLHICYELSACLMDLLERVKIVGPADGVKPRPIINS
jgi:S-DNA-T family DNA segregation ATPase FtsK/SpoIIIE